MSKLTIINKTKSVIPDWPFLAIKNFILGKNYNLNLIVTDSRDIKRLNLTYRNKDESTDILSFPISETEGEIYISPNETRNEAKKFDRVYENFFAFLFIHGCVHLKGHDHGSTMESIEVEARNKFGI